MAPPRAPVEAQHVPVAATTSRAMPRLLKILTAEVEVVLLPAAARRSPTKISPSNVSKSNRQLRLQSRPQGLLAPGDLQLAESPVPELKDGQALAWVKLLSIDPTMRVWMAVDSYLPAVKIGEVMRAGGFAEIAESRHPDYKKGDRITGLTGLQEYVVIDASAKSFFQKLPKIPFVSDTVFLGALGFNGLAAFFGMEIAAPKKGETLVLSAAAGAIGRIV